MERPYKTDQNALDFFDFDSKKAEKLRKAGFGVVNSHIDDGIIQGTGVLVTLAPEGSDATRLLDEKLGQFYGTLKSTIVGVPKKGNIISQKI